MLYQELHRPMYHSYSHHSTAPIFGTSHIPTLVSFDSTNDLQPSIMKTVSKPHMTDDGHHQGRWTKKEHEAFLQGLRLYGREWKQIAKTIPTRTSAQIRSHAQKYFQKLNKEGASKKPESFFNHRFTDNFENLKDIETSKLVGGRLISQVDIGPIIASGPCIISDPQNSAHVPFNPPFIHSQLSYPPFLNQTNCFESPTIPGPQCSNGFVRDQYQEQYQEYVSRLMKKEKSEQLDSIVENIKEESNMQSLIHKCADRLKLNFNDKELCALEFLCSSKKRTAQDLIEVDAKRHCTSKN